MKLNKFLEAVYKNDLQKTKGYIKSGGDVNINSSIALELSVHNGHTEMVRLLLDNGSSVNTWLGDAITTLIKVDNAEIIKLLLDNGSDFNANDGMAIRNACIKGNVNILKVFLDRELLEDTERFIKIAKLNKQDEIVKLLEQYSKK